MHIVSRLILFVSLAIPIFTNGQSDYCADLTNLLTSGRLEATEDILGKLKTPDNVTCPHIVGEVYLRKGRYDKAEEYFLVALDKSEHGSDEEATSLNQLGLAYFYNGNDLEAVEYIQRALAARQELYKSDHEMIAASYNDLGLVLSLKDKDAALDYYEKAIEIYKKVFGPEHEKVAQGLINTASIYSSSEFNFFGDAINNLNEALDIWNKNYPDGHRNTGFVYTNLGVTNMEMGNTKEAIQYQQKALDLYSKTIGNKNPDVAYTYNLLGNIYDRQGEFDQALEYYQKALISNSPKFTNVDEKYNPPITEYFNGTTLLSTLYSKAQAFANRHFEKTLKFSDLKLALDTYQSCDSLIDNIRQITSSENQKLAVSEMASQVYDGGMLICMAMADVAVKKDQYYEMAFYFAEKSKSAVLLEAISDASAKSFASIPKELVDQEAQFKSDIVYFEQQANNAMGAEKKQWSDVLFKLKLNHSEFIKQIESDYPQYFNLKYNVKIPSPNDLKSTLDDQTMLLSYFLSRKTQRVYIFQITSSKFKVESHITDENFHRYISGLHNSIFFQSDETYKLTASELYKKLIPKSIPKNIKRLTIIPAGRLGIVPFETLLSTKVKGKTADFSTFPYLAKDYAISYQYAAALYYQNHMAPIDNSTNKALLCAPINFENLPDLPGTSTEVQSLKNILSNKKIEAELLINDDAKEYNIKSYELDSYKYLHLATHGIVDETNPEKSRIFLNDDATDDGNLFSGEIYNLKLNADLVTLSACETGLGKVSEGEGIIGLSRALVYAGARNLVVSLWQVSDASTSDLMVNFYDGIDKEQYGYALQKAKSKMINSTAYSHPFYWAPFILIGQ